MGSNDAVNMNLGKLWEMGQGGLAGCSLWGHKEFNTTKRLNNNKNMIHDITETNNNCGPPRGNTCKNGMIADNVNIVLEMNRICS